MAQSVCLIAGNICSGKTEYGRYINENSYKLTPLMEEWNEEDRKVQVVPEFIDPTALTLFYRDRKANTEIFEKICLNSRIARHLDAKNKPGLYFFDRGMIEGAATFAKNSCEEGYLTHSALERYVTDLKWGLDQLDRTLQSSWLEQLIVYFQVKDALVLQERYRRRATKGEDISFEYLQRMNDHYEEFFSEIKPIYARYGVKAPEILVIDASIDFNQDKNFHNQVLEKIVTTMRGMNNAATGR